MLPGVYRLTSVPISARQAAMAALLWAGDDAVVSHVTAGALWALDGLQAERVDLWVPSRRAPRSPLVEVHRGTVDAIDRRRVESIWVTSPARTLIDLAAVLEAEVLETALESALRRGLTTPGSIERRLMSLGGRGRRGTGQLRALIDDRGKGAALEFELEVRIWRLLRSAGLRPVRQYSVRYDGRTYRLDFAWPALRVAVEADGFDAHGGRGAFERDHARLAVLCAHGWRVVPVTWEQVTKRRAWVLDTIVRALTSAAA